VRVYGSSMDSDLLASKPLGICRCRTCTVSDLYIGPVGPTAQAAVVASTVVHIVDRRITADISMALLIRFVHDTSSISRT
jgi:hypothetical protein